MTDHRASCARGQRRLVARGSPNRVSMRPCVARQRRAGSTGGARARSFTPPTPTVHEERRHSRVGVPGGAEHMS